MGIFQTIFHGHDDEELKRVNDSLYKNNFELAVKNKTLALLARLYEISILTLQPRDLADKMTEAIRLGLDLDSSSLLLFDRQADTLSMLAIAESERFRTARVPRVASLEHFAIPSASTLPFLVPVIRDKIVSYTTDMKQILGRIFGADAIDTFAEESHMRSLVAFPLVIQNDCIGVLALTLNRPYESLNLYERNAMESLVNVVATALDKAMLYEQLAVANEKLKSLDKLKTEFLSLASHQLRSPLTAIKGYTSMLLDGSFGGITKEQHEAIDRVYQSVEHLRRTVEDLLNVSKIEQGGMKYEMAPFDIVKAAGDIVRDFELVAKKKNLSISFTTNDGAAMITGDMEKIRQVIINVIDNAIKYTPAGSIAVDVQYDAQSKIAILKVKDTGKGIDPAAKETLFQKFSRADGGKTNPDGSGLGLYLAKQIIEAHKGSVRIESEGVGKGSTFIIVLPTA